MAKIDQKNAKNEEKREVDKARTAAQIVKNGEELQVKFSFSFNLLCFISYAVALSLMGPLAKFQICSSSVMSRDFKVFSNFGAINLLELSKVVVPRLRAAYS